MKNKTVIPTLLFLFFYTMLFCQQGEISGILVDEFGEALIGASILIKGTSRGTVTDIDGRYHLNCKVGDILVIAYVGYDDREVVVTTAMFADALTRIEQVPWAPVQTQTSDAYAKALEQFTKHQFNIPSLEDSAKIYHNKWDYYRLQNSIENIEIKDGEVKLTYFKSDLLYEIGFNSTFGVRYFKRSNLPDLQNSFSQGIPVDGVRSFQGPDTDRVFSYGPPLDLLEFDGQDSPYDFNGQLVMQGSGNGMPANRYANELLETTIQHSNDINFNISKKETLARLHISNQSANDLFDRERLANNKISLNYTNNNSWDSRWKTYIVFQSIRDNQPNINGFQNNLLLNLWATPSSFSNQQGTVLLDGRQRRFSSMLNNPEWLLDHNRNTVTEQHFSVATEHDLNITNELSIASKLSYNDQQQEQNFGVVQGTAGFDDGFSSDKDIAHQAVNASVRFSYQPNLHHNELEIKSIIHYEYEDLDFSLMESRGFAPFSFTVPQKESTNVLNQSRNSLRMLQHIQYVLDGTWTFQLTNNSYYSSVQNSKWLLPSASFKLDLKRLFDIQGISKFAVFSSASLDVNDTPLYYRNLSHNSLLLSPAASLSYTTNNDLFIDASINLEQKENFEIGGSLGIGNRVDLEATYFHSKTKGSVFPIVENGIFGLSNVADIRSSGIELSLETNVQIDYSFRHYASITFSAFRTMVETLLNGQDRVPIAGFSNVSKNLVEGEPAGVIIGSTYARDEKGNQIIGDDGFPLVANEPEIIGDPIPDFNIGFVNTFTWKGFELSLSVDIQKGGEIWNGTQNVLNYLGRTQQSALERGIRNFVFSGVNQAGSPNNEAIEFYDPNQPISANRFVRYGFAGVAEDAIFDASFINIKSIHLAYSIPLSNDMLIRKCQIGIHARNIFTWSNFRGNNPYASLFGNSTGQELNFFNLPMLSEIGFTLQLKI